MLIAPETHAKIVGWLNDLGDDGTLRRVMADHTREILAALISDGTIPLSRLATFVDAEGAFTDAAKNLIEQALLGSVLSDPHLVDSVSPSLLAQVSDSLPSLAELKGRPDAWDISPLVGYALKLHCEASQAGISVEEFVKEDSSAADLELAPVIQAVARKLDSGPGDLKKALQSFAAEAKKASAEKSLFEGPDPLYAFNKAFGVEVSPIEYQNAIWKGAGINPENWLARETPAARPDPESGGAEPSRSTHLHVMQKNPAPASRLFKLGLLALIAAAIALAVWMGRYRFDQAVLQDGESYPVRVSRLSGRSEVLYHGVWQSASVLAGLKRPIQNLGQTDIEKLEGDGSLESGEFGTVFSLWLYNGSDFTLKAIGVEIAVKDSHGEESLRKTYWSELQLAPSQRSYCVIMPTFNLGPRQTYSWRVVAAKGTKP